MLTIDLYEFLAFQRSAVHGVPFSGVLVVFVHEWHDTLGGRPAGRKASNLTGQNRERTKQEVHTRPPPQRDSKLWSLCSSGRKRADCAVAVIGNVLASCNCSRPVVFLVIKEYTIFRQTQHLIVLLQRHVSTRTSHHQTIFWTMFKVHN